MLNTLPDALCMPIGVSVDDAALAGGLPLPAVTAPVPVAEPPLQNALPLAAVAVEAFGVTCDDGAVGGKPLLPMRVEPLPPGPSAVMLPEEGPAAAPDGADFGGGKPSAR